MLPFAIGLPPSLRRRWEVLVGRLKSSGCSRGCALRRCGGPLLRDQSCGVTANEGGRSLSAIALVLILGKGRCSLRVLGRADRRTAGGFLEPPEGRLCYPYRIRLSIIWLRLESWLGASLGARALCSSRASVRTGGCRELRLSLAKAVNAKRCPAFIDLGELYDQSGGGHGNPRRRISPPT
jgi:hypothetical protein